jgi:hypothetical protein
MFGRRTASLWPRQRLLACGIDAAEVVNFVEIGTVLVMSRLTWNDKGKGLGLRDSKSYTCRDGLISRKATKTASARLLRRQTCCRLAFPYVRIQGRGSIGQRVSSGATGYVTAVLVTASAVLIVHWKMPCGTDLKCVVPGLWIDAVHSRFWPG